jgi:acetolactate synthase-1/2/3 large subunit
MKEGAKFAQKRSSMKISVANVIVRFLKAARVPYLFGLSGHSIFPIAEAVYAEPDIRFVPVMHELSAAYMAAAYAKGTRRNRFPSLLWQRM